MGETEVRPHTVTTDRAAIYPPVLAVVLPEAVHRASRLDQRAIERYHGHLKGRYRPMRGFKQQQCAQIVCVGHGFMRNLQDGFYRLGFVWHGPGLPHPPRLLTAWNDLTAILRAA
jgi:transposase-like protein